MNAGMESFQDFIGDKHFFKIPVYQRKYDWQQVHCQQLFDDIIKILENNKPHFLGTFVYQRKQIIGNNSFDEYIIIDGQQRITSLILLAKALFNSMNDDDDKEDILYKYIKHQSGKSIKNKCKLIPTEYDKNIFEKIMSHDNFDEIIFDAQEKSSVIYRNFLFFTEKISECEYSAEKIYEVIPLLNIVWINISDGENPQEIFESLNSTGLYLTQSDLIRNYLLMSLNYDFQEELYKKYWLEIEKLLNSSEKVENFMVQYLIVKRKSDSVTKGSKNIRLSNKNLYEVFKEYFRESDKNVEECLNDIYRYAKFYRLFIFNDNDNFDNLSALEKKFYELTYLLDAANSPIILMYLYDRYDKKFFDEKTFINFLDAMISLTFRSKVCGFSGITSQFAGNVILRLDKIKNLDEDSFWKTITFGKGRYAFPKDELFRENLMTKEIFLTIKSSGCKYLLYSLEKISERSAELPKYSSTTIEHIMPQKLNENWKIYLQTKKDMSAYEIFLHTLGNLTLMVGKYNFQVSNSEFEIKKSEYEKSAFFYTNDLKKYSDWTSIQIQIRAKKLANIALKIWSLPEKYNSSTVDVENIFTLDSDFGIFTGTRPAKISIANNDKEIKSWYEFLREIMKILYTLDKNIFKQIIQKDNVPRGKKLFSTEEINFLRPIKIDETFYVEDAFDFYSETILKITKFL